MVYRLRSESGLLLYIGKSWLPDGFRSRMRDHKRRLWGWLIVERRTTFESFRTEQAALDAETAAIETERPLFNDAGTNGRGRTAEQILAERMGM